MSVQIAFIHADPKKKISARLTQIFTKSTAYHCGLVLNEDSFLDMHWRLRIREWPRYQYSPEKWVHLYNTEMSVDGVIESYNKYKDIPYGVFDYSLFLLRKPLHLIGLSTPNAAGIICSEALSMMMRDQGIDSPMKPVPDPGTLESFCRDRYGKPLVIKPIV